MQGALKKYTEGKIDAAEKERKQANDMFDKCKKAPSSEEYEKIVYGENKNFGVIYDIIESNTRNWFFSPKKQKALKEIVECINNDTILKTQFQIYNACKKLDENVDCNEYVSEIFNHAKKLSLKNIIESNQKLIDIINKYHGNTLLQIDDDKINLYESIEFLSTHKPSLQNMQTYMLNKNNIVKYLNENRTNNKQDEDINSILDNIDNYKDLNICEQKFIDFINNFTDLNEAFDTLKSKVQTNINTIISNSPEIETKERWQRVNEQVSELMYNADSIDNFAKLYEIYDKLGK